MHKIHIYPQQSLVITHFSGSITIEEVKKTNMEIAKDPRYSKQFDGVCDFRSAHADFTDMELLGFRELALKSNFNSGNWCLLVSTPIETAMAMIFANKAGKNNIKVFSTVEAASEYLCKDLRPLLDQTDTNTDRNFNVQVRRSTCASIA